MPAKDIAKPNRKQIQQPSAFLMQFAELISKAPGPIVDAACGYGRNAKILADLGCQVFCLDKNADALTTLGNVLSPSSKGEIHPLEIDLSIEPWPYPPEFLGAIINIHYYQKNLIDCFIKSLKPGGFLLIESIDGRKGNYLQLPIFGSIQECLQDNFNLITCQEKKVGPIEYNTATIKIVAQKHLN
jgi:SAM-dependent methyltransferase